MASRALPRPAPMKFTPHGLGVHHLLKYLTPLVRPILDAPSQRRLQNCVNISDLRDAAKQRAHKMAGPWPDTPQLWPFTSFARVGPHDQKTNAPHAGKGQTGVELPCVPRAYPRPLLSSTGTLLVTCYHPTLHTKSAAGVGGGPVGWCSTIWTRVPTTR